MRVELDPRTRIRDGGRTLLTPTGRLLRLTAAGAQELAGTPGPVLTERLLGAGAAHPRPTARSAGDVTVVVPVRDRVLELDRCLATAGTDVLVVDDGSRDPGAVEAVCARHGARYLRRPNGGPAAARNTALPLLSKDFVAFLDSDCVPPQGWLEALRGHFDDAAVGAVAPRLVGGPRSPLDLGRHEAAVRPGTAVGYVPTAALLVRRSALTRFDEDLRYGEDVDLVWRMCAAGWVVRYDPSVVVEHREPARLRDRLVRRYRYGTSAAPLSLRHPGHLTHLVLPPWPTAVVTLVLVRRPAAAAVVAAAATAQVERRVHHLPTSARLVGSSVTGTALGVGRALALAGPLAWLLARDRRVVALLLGSVLAEWLDRRPAEDPVRFAARALLDQAAYGAGVLAGCLAHRTTGPLIPRVRAAAGGGARSRVPVAGDRVTATKHR